MFTEIRRVFLAAVLGILLIMIGGGADSEWVTLIGSLVFAGSLLWGGFFLQAEHIALRIAMLAIAGLATISLISSGSISSYIPSL